MKSNQPILQTKKLLDLQSYIHINKPSIVVLNETWLNLHVNSNEIIHENYYKCFRSDRTEEDKAKYNKSGGGGVIIFCRQDLDILTKSVKIPCRLPILSIELKMRDNSKICLSTFYRYGYSDTADFLEAERYFNDLHRKYRSICLIGDLNLSTVRDWSNPVANDTTEDMYVNLFSNLGLTSLINQSTHRGGNTLDLVLTNKPSLFSITSVEPDILVPSDHYTINLEIKKKRYKKRDKKRRNYAYKRGNWDHVNTELSGINWEMELSSSNTEQNFKKFKSLVDIVIRKFVPMVSINDRNEPPWYDGEMRDLKRQKERLRKRSKSISATQTDIDSFNSFSINYKSKATSKQHDFLTKVDPCEDPNTVINKRFWKHVKSNEKSSRIPDTVYLGSRFRTDTQDKCELFNHFFGAQFSVPSNYDTEINLDQDSDLVSVNELFNASDILSYLKAINPSKAAGPDNIDGYILKNCCNSLAVPLTILFRQSYTTGQIPQDWKDANVVPVHKKNDKANIENYRPISLTSLVMKIYEKCIRNKLHELTLNNITDFQHGFLPNRSCTTQMIDFTDHLAVGLNSSHLTDIIYFDFSKAFDSVSHDLILLKLKNTFGITGKFLQFFKFYLQNRRQRVVIDGKFSQWVSVQSGVPQGSILGPLLFVLFINDIVESTSPGTNIRLYADDMKIWRRIISRSDQVSLQNDINNLHSWSVINKIKFHPSKCKHISSTLKREPLNTTYFLNDTCIEKSDCEKDLGVFINNKLTFTKHHQATISKASQKLGLIKRNCSITTCPVKRKTLYLSLVRSNFEHCSTIWRPISDAQVGKFVKLQKRAVKWILNENFSRYSDLVYSQKLMSLKILPMDLKFKQNDLVIFHKVYYDNSVIKLPSYIHRQSDNDTTVFQRPTRLHNEYDMYKVKSSINPKVNSFKNSFFYRCHLEWNKLPLELRSIENPIHFKVSLIKFLWSSLGLDLSETDNIT